MGGGQQAQGSQFVAGAAGGLAVLLGGKLSVFHYHAAEHVEENVIETTTDHSV